MSTATFHKDGCLTWVAVNGRRFYVNRITEIRKASKARFEGVAQGGKFVIEGGRHGGGTSRDWFLDWEIIGDGPSLYCTSIADAIKLIENA